jgi:cobyric acid synthase
MFLKLLQKANAPVLLPPCLPSKIANIEVTVDGIVILVKPVFRNTCSLIVVTKGGMVKLVKLVQSLKAAEPIVVIEGGNEMLTRLLHELNAPSIMAVTNELMLTEVRLVQL